MVKLDIKEVERYLSKLFNSRVKLELAEEKRLGKAKLKLKDFGYGKPYFINFKLKGKEKSVVLETGRQDTFGHDYPSDRAQNLLLAHSTFNKLPKHVKSLDVGVFMEDGTINSVGKGKEFFILMEKVEGREYAADLNEIANRKNVKPIDEERCRALSDYLVKIHRKKKNAPHLYIRRVRELVGHSECIMGLIDNYPPNSDYTSDRELIEIERKCVEWRWKLKGYVNRLCQVHGDYHPWNILFRKGTDFTVLDRSRGEWGEPADDVAGLTINYIFFSIQQYGKLTNPFGKLFKIFMENYISKTEDKDLLKVIQPFYAWRGLVIANPIWYPNLNYNVRRKIFNFINNILNSEELNLNINSYLNKP